MSPNLSFRPVGEKSLEPLNNSQGHGQSRIFAQTGLSFSRETRFKGAASGISRYRSK